jgi:hypothetical protein
LIHTKQRHKTRHRKTVDVSLFEDVYVNTVGSYISTVFMCDLIWMLLYSRKVHVSPVSASQVIGRDSRIE